MILLAFVRIYATFRGVQLIDFSVGYISFNKHKSIPLVLKGSLCNFFRMLMTMHKLAQRINSTRIILLLLI